LDAFTSLMPDGRLELREGYAEVGDVRLHYVEAGDGPLIILLHGFPEFWFGWRLQIAPLVAAGFRVVAPDTRGYNLSSKPEGFEAYAVDLLAEDIRGLIGERGAESALLVGHDWGGSIAWTVAMNHPEVVDRLAILNAAHPRRLSEGLHNPNQLRKSWYFFFFATPGLPENVVHARDWHFFRHFLHDANPPYTPQEIERYVEAWSQPGAAAGMINYYRASVRQSQKEAAAKLRPISAPTLVIWGERDSYLGSELAEPHRDDVPNLERVDPVMPHRPVVPAGAPGELRLDAKKSDRAMGEFLAQLIAEVDLGRPHIVAPDVGTSAALFAAAAHPERIATVIVGTGGAAVPIQLGEPLRSWVLDPDLERYRAMDPRAIVSAAIDTIAGGVPDDIRADYLASYDGDRFVESMRYVRRYPEELPELAQLLPQITMPVTIINGRHDRVVPVANADFLDARLPNSRVVLIDGGHFIWEEAPTEYASTVLDSISGNWP
jgi:pimeloyl-ACP methyl ester carboxylesterase